MSCESATVKDVKAFCWLIRGPKCGKCGKHLNQRTIAGYIEKRFPYGTQELVPVCRQCFDGEKKG